MEATTEIQAGVAVAEGVVAAEAAEAAVVEPSRLPGRAIIPYRPFKVPFISVDYRAIIPYRPLKVPFISVDYQDGLLYPIYTL